MKLVDSIWSKKSWVVDDKGKRIGSKMHIKSKKHVGPILSIEDETYKDFMLAPNHFLTGADINITDGKYYSICGRDVSEKLVKATYDIGGNLISDDMYITTYEENVGIMTVEYKGRICYADKDLNWISDKKYNTQYVYFINGVAAVKNKDGTIELINKKCETIKCLPGVKNIWCLSKEPLLFGIRNENKEGVVDSLGKTVIDMEYDRVISKDNFIKLILNNRVGLADIKGNILLECIYKELIELSDKFVVEEFPIKEVKRNVIKKYSEEA